MVADKVSNDNSFKIIAGVSVCAVVAVFAVVGIALNIYNASIVSDINEANDYINDPETIAQLEEFDNRTAMLENVRTYKDAAQLAADAYDSQPQLGSDLMTALEDAAASVDSSIEYTEVTYEAGVITLQVTATGKNNEYAQTIPSSLVQAILESDTFYNVDYVGYGMTDNVTEKQVLDDDGKVVSSSTTSEKVLDFEIVMHVKSDSDEIAQEHDSQTEEDADADTDGEESDE
jgi:hypothetical protein